MILLQGFILLMGVVGQIMIASHDSRGYFAWIAGNVGLVEVYVGTQQTILIILPVMNIILQSVALIIWIKKRAASLPPKDVSRQRANERLSCSSAQLRRRLVPDAQLKRTRIAKERCIANRIRSSSTRRIA